MSLFNTAARKSCEITSDHVTALLKTLQHLLISLGEKAHSPALPSGLRPLKHSPHSCPPTPPSHLSQLTLHSLRPILTFGPWHLLYLQSRIFFPQE